MTAMNFAASDTLVGQVPATIPANTGKSATVQVNFPAGMFPNPPTVLLTAVSSQGFRISVTIDYTSTTGFGCHANASDVSSGAIQVTINWFAIYPGA